MESNSSSFSVDTALKSEHTDGHCPSCLIHSGEVVSCFGSPSNGDKALMESMESSTSRGESLESLAEWRNRARKPRVLSAVLADLFI